MVRTTIKMTTMLILLYQTVCFGIGTLYARRALSSDNAVPLWLKTYDAEVTITDQMAVTHITHVFRNETGSQLEGLFIFPLPANAVVTEMALWENGIRKIGTTMESQTARQQYESVVRKSIDPALLEYMGNNVFKLSVFPINPVGQTDCERKIEITYTELLPYDNNNISYKFLMKTVNMSSKPVQRASINIKLSTQNKILSLNSPTHPTGLVIQQVTDKDYNMAYGEENATSEKDLLLLYNLENSNYALKNCTYTPNGTNPLPFDSQGDDSYYLLWVTPPDSLTKTKIISKNITFVADVSSSMAGARIQQLRTALKAMVGMLNKSDNFNIIPFSTGNNPFNKDLVPATGQNITNAQEFISQLGESGLTNIEGALTAALKNGWSDTSFNVIIFLTDGKPTWPINSSAAKIIDTVKTLNKDSITIFTFGIGDSIDIGFLQLLARNNGAFFQQITADDSISLVMKNFMEKISYPLMRNVNLNYGGLDRYDFFPRNIPAVYSGTQVVQLGRYRKNGEFPVTCSGKIDSKEISFSKTLAFPSDSKSPFVARMWASEKIDYLLEEIAIYGENAELKKAVIDLSIKYNIITPYTSMVTTDVNRLSQDKTVKISNRINFSGNYPNPFIKTTKIKFTIPHLATPEFMSLKIFDYRGRLVKVLVNELTLGGAFSIMWNSQDEAGKMVTPGTYIAVLKIGNECKLIPMKLIK